MKTIYKNIIPAAALALTLGMSSCSDILEISPKDPDVVTNIQATQLFNKCHANIAVAGQGGANGDSDIDGLDGGTTGYVRQMFNANELTTDEAICGWGDEGLAAFDYNTYDSSHPMLRGFYYRLNFGVTICNQYLTDYADADATMTAEVRFLRALNYYELMDCFGNVPFTTVVSADKPKQIKRADLYKWIESELLDIEGTLSEPKPKKEGEAGYGRVDKAACWMLLSRLYLNAQVYTGTAQWAKAAEYAKKVMDSPYKLYTTDKTDPSSQTWSAYQQLFMGDNGTNGASVEAVFPIIQDGITTTSWGTSLFLMAGAMDKDVVVKKDGTAGNNTDQSWGGNRCRPDLIKKFFPRNDAPNVNAYVMPEAAGDDRAIFDGVDRILNNTEVGSFKNGFATGKFNNFKTDGSAGRSSTFADADFFFFRAAESYLTYAEATARLNNGTPTAEGVAALNALRTRAKAEKKSDWTLKEICDEWSREFYFEGIRRPTLIRFGYFGGNNNYTWQWKGGAYDGTRFSANKNIFAIPTQDMTVNENLVQNPGY